MKHLESYNKEYAWYKECMRIIDMSIRLEDLDESISIDYRIGSLASNGTISYPMFYNRKNDKLEGDTVHLNYAINVYAKLCISIDIILDNVISRSPFKNNSNISYNSDCLNLLIKILNETNSIYNNIKINYDRFISLEDNRISIKFLKK